MNFIFNFRLHIAACLLGVSACNTKMPPVQTERFDEPLTELSDTADSTEDPLIVRFDSLMSVSVPVPPLIDKNLIDKIAARHFSDLSNGTSGELSILLSSKYVAKEMASIIEKNAVDSADILLMIDKTGSMSDDIHEVNKNIDLLLASLKQYKQIRLAVATYGDRNEDGDKWFGFENFGQSVDLAERFIKTITTTGGGDYPESVSDAFFKAMDKHFFRSNTKRMVLLLGDAPSLEPPLARYSVADMVERANKDGIKMNFYPVLLYAGEERFESAKPRMRKLSFISKLYPNPCSGQLNLELSETGKYTFEIFDQSGKKLLSENSETALFTKDLDLPDGVYVIRVSDKRKNFDTGKFVISR